jgi:hypothetical protein
LVATEAYRKSDIICLLVLEPRSIELDYL